MNRTAIFCVMLAGMLASSLAQAANVGTFGLVNPGKLPAPHTGTSLNLADIEAGALAGYDVFWIGHADGPGWSQAACDQVEVFVTSGGGIVTEWNGVTMLFDNLDPGTYVPMPLPQCGWFTGTVANGSNLGTNTPINVLNPASPLMAGLSNPFSMGNGSQFFYTTDIDNAQWTVDADFTGFGGTWPAVMWSDVLGGIVVVGVMDYQDVLPGDATASTLLGNMIDFAATGAVDRPAQAGITVTKTFSDGLIADVEVSISCNDGFVNADSAIISSDGGSFRFVVTDFISGSMDCDITEADTEGYASDSCTFTNVVGGEYTCALVNNAEPATIGVTKVWNFEGAGGDPVDQTAQIRLTAATGVLVGGAAEDCAEGALDSECVILEFIGSSPVEDDEDDPNFGELIPQTVEVNSVDGGVTVSLAEINTNSAVEVSNDCDGVVEDLEPGDSATCGFTNTVFFEGIPTLSHYGLALMALLMLGVGMVGFRRFA